MAFNETLAHRLRVLFAGNHDISEKKMFGGLCLLCRGHMFLGIVNDELMARVGPENYSATLQKSHVREMDFTGKPMKGYVFVAPEGILTDQQLEDWAGLCLRFVDTLRAK